MNLHTTSSEIPDYLRNSGTISEYQLMLFHFLRIPCYFISGLFSMITSGFENFVCFWRNALFVKIWNIFLRCNIKTIEEFSFSFSGPYHLAFFIDCMINHWLLEISLMFLIFYVKGLYEFDALYSLDLQSSKSSKCT